ncbi:undecaprenyl/decaprenyl-phosphate alpha-N-acetylglucosaminyl 1-phosphate transferase [Candidatus Gracilibacteria bacterium]|nr:undecaprenyl/decaprenyl-phosphate alpha-N-acetylglucosaminyl 1-phosphate transferase [Candidatus Gracilibacteria bacterium]
MDFLIKIIILFLCSGIVSWILLEGISRLWRRWGIVDLPHLYENEGKRKPAPYSIGIILVIMILIFAPIISRVFDFSSLLVEKLEVIAGLAAIIGIVSFIDDLDTIKQSRIHIPPLFRLGLQIFVGLVIGITSIKITYISGIFGDIMKLDEFYVQLMILGDTYNIYYIPLIITIAWYVLVFNSVNFSDGIPGLTGSFSLVSFIIMGGLALKLYLVDQNPLIQENSKFMLTFLAIIIPTTFFMTRLDMKRSGLIGDTGTIMLGFILATSAIIVGGKIATAMSVLGIYLIDALYVIGIRIMKGKNPMKGDRTHHLHFRLLELGLSQSFIRNLICGLAFLFGIGAIFMNTTGKIILLIFMTVTTLGLTKILSMVKK